jgi:uncharacterized protein
VTSARDCRRLAVAALALAAVARPTTSWAQGRAAVEAERSEYAAWLATAPVSPRRAVTVRPIGPGLTLGPTSADVPLAGVRAESLQERDGRVSLVGEGQTIALPRGRPHPLGTWRLLVSGPPGRATLTVFAADPRSATPPSYYPYDSKLALTVALTPDPSPSTQRILAPDGVEVEATEAGSVAFPLGGAPRTLRVMRLPGATEDESDLEIYFRDATADHGTYPAGRFVSLIPLAGGRYLLDFNRARNPFCAYNTVYPCPAPWRGNLLPTPVEAGERYHASPPPSPRPPGD